MRDFDRLDCVIGRYWEMVERLKIKQFYTAPTAIRLLLKCGDHFVHQYNRDTLRVLGCGEHICKFIWLFYNSPVGEPLNTEAWEWYHRVVGEERCTVVDTWWQTGKWSFFILLLS